MESLSLPSSIPGRGAWKLSQTPSRYTFANVWTERRSTIIKRIKTGRQNPIRAIYPVWGNPPRHVLFRAQLTEPQLDEDWPNRNNMGTSWMESTSDFRQHRFLTLKVVWGFDKCTVYTLNNSRRCTDSMQASSRSCTDPPYYEFREKVVEQPQIQSELMGYLGGTRGREY